MKKLTCPLCECVDISLFCSDKRREYFRCSRCDLTFVPPQYWLSEVEEKQEYDQHINSPSDQGYRGFLNRIYTPIKSCVPLKNAHGLDFGCGPGPTLSVMFEERGAKVSLYDKFYYADETVLARQYDFVTATEVWEHLASPNEVLACLWRCVKPGGVLGVMTKLALDAESFAGWHYKNDQTHIIFFSITTLKYLEKQWGAQLEMVAADAFIFRKAI